MVSTHWAKRVSRAMRFGAIALAAMPLAALADTTITSYDNTGNTFVVDSTTGNVILENGPFIGGTISTRDGFYFRSHYGSLRDVTLEGKLVSAYGTQVRNLTLSAGSVISVVSRLDVGIGTIPGDEQVINGTGEIVFNFSEDFFDGLQDYNSHVTIGPGITIRTGSSDGKIRMENFVNQGTISAETAGKRLIVQNNSTSTYFPLPWRNDGLLRARNGARLSLFGEIPVGGLGNFDSQGGIISIAQKLFNTNNVLQLDSPARILSLEGNGQIIGGEVAMSNGGALQLLPSDNGTLLGVRVNGDLFLPTNSNLQFINGSLADGRTIHMSGEGARMAVGGAVSALNVTFESPTGSTMVSFNPATVPADAVIKTAGGSGGVGAAVNQGTLIAQTPGKTLFVQGNNPVNQNLMRVTDGTFQVDNQFTNNGVVEVSGGNFLANAGINGSGAIKLSGGTLTLGGQTSAGARGAIQQSGGVVSVIGTIDNSNATVNLSSTRRWQLGEGGNIQGGAITSEDGTALVSVGNSSITNASVAADLSISGGMLTLNNVPPLAGRNIVLSSPVGAIPGGLALPWSGTLEGDTVRFDGGGDVGFINPAGGEPAGSLLIVGASSTIRTGSGSGRLGAVAMRLLNEGLISADGHQVQLAVNNFYNIGVVEARNGGRFEAASGNVIIQNLTDGTGTQNGTLTDGLWAVYGNSTMAMGSSTIAHLDANVILDGPGSTFAALAPLNLNFGSLVLLHGRDFNTVGAFLNRGELTLGSGVDFRVAADFREGGVATLHVILAGSDIESFGQLSAGTSVSLAGFLDVQLDENYQPNLGDSFTIISAAFVGGTFESATFPQLSGGETMEITYAPDHVTLTVVPEPASMALAVAITMCAARRRRDFIFRKLQPPN